MGLTRMLIGRAVGLFVIAGISSCTSDVFHCTDDSGCIDGARAGVCAAPGYCAFEDETCVSGLAYGEMAPNDVAGECVGHADDATSTTSPATTGTDAPPPSAMTSSSSSSEGVPAASTGSETCPAESACVPDDPCATAGECVDGECVANAWITCDDPPSSCLAPAGVCNGNGACEYAPLDEGTGCSDGDDCTVDDVCDGAGACIPGDVCPSANPCEVATCIDGACSVEPLADGTSCGPEPADRCCNGGCVDISSDTDHCGGCNTGCAPGLDCESISETSSCDVSPAATSGRCRCEYSNAQCPIGQICRTYTPYTDRCVPPAQANCDGMAVYQNSCPSFCSY